VTGKSLTSDLSHPVSRSGDVLAAKFSPDGKMLATISEDGTARVWDSQTGSGISDFLQHDDGVRSARFSPDGSKLVTAAADGTAQVWDVATSGALARVEHDGIVNFAEFSPDGDRIITASEDKTVRVWDADSGHPLTEPLHLEAGVRFAHFSPDGVRVLTVSGQAAQIWDAAIASVPTPSWLPDLAEAVGRRRFSTRGWLENVPANELWKLQQQLHANPRTGFYIRWGRWFFSDRTARTISPWSSISATEYIQRRIQENSLESLREALRLSPTNGLALSRLANLLLTGDQAQNPKASVEAEFFIQRAIELHPDEAEAWLAQAKALQQSGKLPEAMAKIDSAIRDFPLSPALWLGKGRLLERTNRLDEAMLALSKAIDLADDESAFRDIREKAIKRRAPLLSRLGRKAESRADYEELLQTGYFHYRDADECNQRAWVIVVKPTLDNESVLALLLAETAVNAEPKNRAYQNTLGVAQYRVGEYRKAVNTLLKCGELDSAGLTGHDLFFLAMAHQKLGESQSAMEYYNQALRWQEEHGHTSEELQSIKAEAESLLGIGEHTPTRDAIQLHPNQPE
jgi:tetratricopeptide (TPR) repeat protein